MSNRWSVRRTGVRVTQVITEHDEVDVQKMIETIAEQPVPTLDPRRVRSTQRIVIYRPPYPPRVGTVRRQRLGSLYVKPDDGYGQGYGDQDLTGQLYPLDAFEVLACLWMAIQRHGIDNWSEDTARYIPDPEAEGDDE